MSWAIARPTAGFLITSDNPVIRQCDPATFHPIYGDHGFMNKTVQVTFPLSPSVLLVMSWQELGSAFEIPLEYVEQQNNALAAQSDQYLYAHKQDPTIMQLAAKFRNIA